MGHRWRPVSAGKEVGQAGDDADGHFRLDLHKSLGKNAHVATRKQLGSLQIWSSPAACLVDVTLNVGIAEKSVSSDLSGSHYEPPTEPQV